MSHIFERKISFSFEWGIVWRQRMTSSKVMTSSKFDPNCVGGPNESYHTSFEREFNSESEYMTYNFVGCVINSYDS